MSYKVRFVTSADGAESPSGELKGIGHLAADTSGRPDEVARHLRTFFSHDAARS